MKDHISLVGLVKAKVDNGFSQAGRKLRSSDPADRALMLLAARSIALGNALCVLAQNNHSNEALPLLRSLWELSARAAWIAETDSGTRAQAFLKDAGQADWADFYKEPRGEAKDWLREHVNANAAGLPWGHVFQDGHAKGLSGTQVLEKAVTALAGLLAALQKRWPESFGGGEEILRKLKDAGSQTG